MECSEQTPVNLTKTLIYYYTHAQITTEYVLAKRQSGLPGTGMMEAIVSVQIDKNNLMVS